jgi:hypothetical protein
MPAKPKGDAKRDAFMAAARIADAARVVGKEGRGVRNTARRDLELYVNGSHGPEHSVFGPREHAFLYVLVEGIGDRTATLKAWKDGAALPPE